MTRPTKQNVLLIESNPRETDLYSDLIREISDCKIDVMSRIGGSIDWLVPSNYQLVVIDTTVIYQNDSPERVRPLDLLEKIKRASPDTSVIFISQRASVEEAVSALRMGAEDYLKKPFSLESFKLAIKRGLDRKFIFGANASIASYLHLLNSCQMISASLEQSRIFSILKSYFNQELQATFSAIYAFRDEKPVRIDSTDVGLEEILNIALYAANPFAAMIASDETFRVIDRGQMTPGLFVFRFRAADAEDYFCVSLSPKISEDLKLLENRLHLLKRQIEVTGRNISQYKGVQNLIYVDDATGLYNTRYLNTLLDEQIKAYERTKAPFAVLFVDIDHFKTVNDGHGHLVGTKLLNEVGFQLRKHVRDSDCVFRYGGDEFVAVLSPCDLETASTVAERIRSSIEQESFLKEEGLDIRFTVSIGVALYPIHAKTKESIIELADQAMYSAKKRSRNRVEVLGDTNRSQVSGKNLKKAS